MVKPSESKISRPCSKTVNHDSRSRRLSPPVSDLRQCTEHELVTYRQCNWWNAAIAYSEVPGLVPGTVRGRP
jgi:hypothetical protein